MAGCCMMAGVACQAYEFAPPPTEDQDLGSRAGEGQVSSIARASTAMAHLASQNINDIRHAALAYTFVRKVCAHSSAERSRSGPKQSQECQGI